MSKKKLLDNVEEYYTVDENIWGAERGAYVSPGFT